MNTVQFLMTNLLSPTDRCRDRALLALCLLGPAPILDELKRVIWWMGKPHLPTRFKTIGVTEQPVFECGARSIRCREAVLVGSDRLLLIHARGRDGRGNPSNPVYVTAAGFASVIRTSQANGSCYRFANTEILPSLFCSIGETLYAAAPGSSEILMYSLTSSGPVTRFSLEDIPVAELFSSGGYLFALKNNYQNLRVLPGSLSCCYHEVRFRLPVLSVDVSASVPHLRGSRVVYVFRSDQACSDGVLRLSSLRNIDEDEVAIDMPRTEKCRFLPNCNGCLILIVRRTHYMNLPSTPSDYDIIIFDVENLYCLSLYKMDYMRSSSLVDIKITDRWYILLMSETPHGSLRDTVLALES